MMEDENDMVFDTDVSMRRYVLSGYAALAALVFGFGGWAVASSINGAVIANASIVVESNVKSIQHKDGGIVEKIFVRDGDRVEAGDLLIRLDETLTRANLAILNQQLCEVEARQARLEAERDNTESVIFPEELLTLCGNLNATKIVQGEETLFEARRKAHEAELAQSEERAIQLGEQIKGMLSQIDSKESEIKLIEAQLERYYVLLNKGLIPRSRILELERSAVALKGQHGELLAQVAGTRARVAEVLQYRAQADQERMTAIIEQLRDVQSRNAELSERRIAAEDLLRRNEIRALQAGIVHQLTVHTVGGVISPRDTIMQIVPQSDALLVEARVAPGDVDQIYPLQTAVVRLSAFDQRSTPELRAFVETISAETTLDPVTQLSYFTVRLRFEDDEITRLRGRSLVPGMPAEVFIQTGERSPISYLTKPLTDQMARVFREE